MTRTRTTTDLRGWDFRVDWRQSDGTNSSSRPETNSVSYSMNWNRFRHEMTFGGDFRRQEYNYFSESNPRGSLSFNGTATQETANGVAVAGTGSDFADFLLGLPDTSAVVFGNADKYLRQSVYDAYFDDDFRVNPELSIRAGLRWEYGAPVTEIKNRLVNLDPTPGFASVPTVCGSAAPAGSPAGACGSVQPGSLMHPDYSFPEPRIGIGVAADLGLVAAEFARATGFTTTLRSTGRRPWRWRSRRRFRPA